MDGDREWFSRVEDLASNRGSDLPLKFSSYVAHGADGEARYGEMRDDAYGQRLRSVRVDELLALQTPDVPSHRQLAVLAYLRALPPDTAIVLDWY